MPLLRRITRNTSSSMSPDRYCETARSKRSMSRCCSASRSRGAGTMGVMLTWAPPTRKSDWSCQEYDHHTPMQRSSSRFHDQVGRRGSAAGIDAHLAERVVDRRAQPPRLHRVHVGDEPRSGATDLFHGEHDPRFGVVVV